MTSWARHHAARRETTRLLDRVMGRERIQPPPRPLPTEPIQTTGRSCARAVTGRHGPEDPLTRLVILAICAATGPEDRATGRLTHVEIARRTALSERTVRDRLAWALEHGWLMVIGPRIRRRYYLAIPPVAWPVRRSIRRMAPDLIRREVPDQMRRPAPDRPPEEDDDGPEEELA